MSTTSWPGRRRSRRRASVVPAKPPPTMTMGRGEFDIALFQGDQRVAVANQRRPIGRSSESAPGPCSSVTSRSRPQSWWSFRPAAPNSGYETTAMMLKTNSTNAAKRVPRPSTRSTGKNSSTPVPRKAAIAGGSSGTAYSFSNSETVLDQLAIFVRPDWKKTTATKRRTARSATGAPKERARPTRRATAARRIGSAPVRRGSVASRVAGGLAFSFERFGTGRRSAAGDAQGAPAAATSALLDGGGAAVDVLGLVGQLSTGNPFAGAGRHQDPGLGVAVGGGAAGARALARAAVVLAGLDDAGALLGVALGGERHRAGGAEADGDEAGEGAADQGIRGGVHGVLRIGGWGDEESDRRRWDRVRLS